MTNLSTDLQKIYWADIRQNVKTINPVLGNIIDKIDPGQKYPLYKARYSFGDGIIHDGRLHLPHGRTLLPLEDSQVPTEIKKHLGYNLNTNPVSIILKNSTEIFILLGNRTVSLYGLITPGKIFSTSRILSEKVSYSPPFLWDMTAGARSIFMLPKISERMAHERIKQLFNVQESPPAGLLDHWQVFKEIAHHKDFNQTWTTEILFFTKSWFEHLDDKAWRDFKLYMLQEAWNGSEFWRNQFVWDLAFSLIQQNANLKPNPYLADTAKHLLAMGVGAVSGFAPAINDIAGPCKRLQQIYNDVYSLKYQPIIMHPYTLAFNDKSRSVYYSLQYPSTLEFSPKSKVSNKITDLRELQHILNKYFAEIKKGYLNIKGTPFQDLVDKAKYDYFHINIKSYKNIHNSDIMPMEDKYLKSIMDDHKEFPKNSSFIRGCIRITHL